MHLAQDGRQRVTVRRVGGRDRAFDRQAERVDGDMALAALDFLGGVEAARPAGLRRLDRLAVDDDRRRRGLTALRLASAHHEHTDDWGPQSAVAPSVEPVLHGRERGKVLEPISPGTPRADQIEQRIQDLARAGRLATSSLGAGSNGRISAYSASDKSLEYRSRTTSYFARSASLHGITTLQMSLQTPENQTQ